MEHAIEQAARALWDHDRPALDGELIDLPPEPPHDHIVTNSRGNVWIWHAEPDLWVEVDSEFGLVEPWEVIAQSNRGLTVYKPIKEYK